MELQQDLRFSDLVIILVASAAGAAVFNACRLASR